MINYVATKQREVRRQLSGWTSVIQIMGTDESNMSDAEENIETTRTQTQNQQRTSGSQQGRGQGRGKGRGRGRQTKAKERKEDPTFGFGKILTEAKGNVRDEDVANAIKGAGRAMRYHYNREIYSGQWKSAVAEIIGAALVVLTMYVTDMMGPAGLPTIMPVVLMFAVRAYDAIAKGAIAGYKMAQLKGRKEDREDEGEEKEEEE